MLTVTRRTLASATSRSSERVPRPVWTRIGLARVRPWSKAYLATHRMPLPHISASLPSALNIRMRTSAAVPGSGGTIRISPSAPIPTWRSDTALATAGGSTTASAKPST